MILIILKREEKKQWKRERGRKKEENRGEKKIKNNRNLLFKACM
jgi:hypothetical protein